MTQFQLHAIEQDGARRLAVPEGAAQFADLYRGLPLGAYTALRTFARNKFLYLDRHLARTERSMALLGMDYALDEARLRRALHEIVTAAGWPEMRVRIDVLAAAPAGSTAAALGTTSRELIAIQPFTPPPPELYERGVAVAFAAGLARDNPPAKAADFAARRPVPAGLSQLEGGATRETDEPYEYLLLDDRDRILEGTGTNFWAVRDGTVYTAGEGVLEGITREIALRIIGELDIPLRLEAVGADEVATLDEAALSGSSRAFMPVVSIAGQRVGDGRPGPIGRRILAAYNAFVAGNIRPAV